MDKGIVFNIQRYTINDGPGIRTEIFLKGCPMKCRWCSNPESQRAAIEPGVYPSKCISQDRCGLCTKACRQHALIFNDKGIVGIDRDRCKGCMKCAESCPAEAIRAWGEVMRLDDVMQIIERDRGYYEQSGGGVTISGGEPLLQKEFTRSILKACRQAGIHTCLESTFCTDWESIEPAVEYADLLISDLKHVNDEVHRRYTGAGCQAILTNLRRLAASGHEMILRIPVIPGVNDDMQNIRETADYINDSIGDRLRTLQLLSFMRMGEEKCHSLGRAYEMDDLEFDRKEFQEKVQQIADYFNSRGINCVVGTRENGGEL